MSIAAALLPEFDQETAVTRKTLERIPEGKFDWRPHDKSMTLEGLATHLSNLPSWTALTIKQDSFDMAPKDGEPFRVEPVTSVKEALEAFDKNVADARAALADASDEDLMGSWSLLAGGDTVFTMPKVAVLRSFVMNHMIHHRAQLGMYLRLNDVAVPAMYGPSADEQN